MNSKFGFVLTGLLRQGELTPEQNQWIREVDTFFIASSGPGGKTDASHLGGNSGFTS
ncbi:hypothetical protein GCM10010911_19840 [Paenibacillus nasutitermitis]|uniref:Uncharacterized protein n=1 Tax=Paenibacillus nasutitermitis TaxID=1652958 RepID=A0A916YUS8_9BACL|nr:hypothetical protein GCM10010911_19840 [Paenibacillus nasutitermitis]